MAALLLLLLPAPEWSDAEIAKLAYDATYRHPKGFEVDPRASAYHHQKSWLTDDAAQARRMVEDLLKKSNIPDADRKIVETKTTVRGFDFRAGRWWYRVHRPSWFSWNVHYLLGGDAALGRDGQPHAIGTLGVRPLSALAVKRFAEYDWARRNANTSHHKVLASSGKETKTAWVHVLETVTFVGGDWGMHDTILRWRITFTVDKKTGKTTKSVKHVRDIAGRKHPAAIR